MSAGVVMATALYASTVMAGGIIGDVFREAGRAMGIEPLKDAGDALDHGHEQLKNAVPAYKATEEGVSGAVRHGAGELAGETLGPAGRGDSRFSERRHFSGRAPHPGEYPGGPPSVFFAPDVLASVQFRVGQGHELSLHANSFRFGDRDATTLDDVIAFRRASDAFGNLSLWAHELGHVLQYRDGGVDDFAKRYVKHAGHMEDDADRIAGEFVSAHNALAQKDSPGGWRGGGSQRGGTFVTHRCQIMGIEVVIDSTARVSPYGRVRRSRHPHCAFDIIRERDAYCVNRADGSILGLDLRGWYPVGHCTRVAG